MTFIPNCIPSIAGNEKKYLNECVGTGWLSSVGPFVDKFEKEFANYHNEDEAVAVSSGTAAIHLGLIALGVKQNDLVLSSDITFVGGVNPIKYLGANPIFLPVDENTLNISPTGLQSFIDSCTEYAGTRLVHKNTKRRISCLILTHLYGIPADIDEILKITNKYNIKVLEDAAESLGAKFKNKLVGTFGDIGCFSFNGNKVITSGGGGMILSKKKEYLEHCKHLSTQAKTSTFGFIHNQIGYNYRMSNLCAAVGLAQLEKLDEFIEKKRKNFKNYQKLITDSTWEILEAPDNIFSTYWMVLVRNKINDNTNIFEQIEILSKNGIGIRPIWYPLHLMDIFHNEITFKCNQNLALYTNIFCLPSSVGIASIDQKQVVVKLMKI